MYSANEFKFSVIEIGHVGTQLQWKMAFSVCGVHASCAKKSFSGGFSYDFTVIVYGLWQPKICVRFIETYIQ